MSQVFMLIKWCVFISTQNSICNNNNNNKKFIVDKCPYTCKKYICVASLQKGPHVAKIQN